VLLKAKKEHLFDLKLES